MPAGFFAKSLSSLLSSASRWVEFADGTTAPTHGAIFVDPATGLPYSIDDAEDAAVSVAGFASGALVAGPQTAPTGVLFELDTSGYGHVALHVTAAGTGNTISFLESGDGINWEAVNGYQNNLLAGRYLRSTTFAGTFVIPCAQKYLRVFVSTYGSGAISAVAALRKHSATIGPRSGTRYYRNAVVTENIKSAAGLLQHVNITKKGSGSSSVSLYDSTSGTGNPIAVIDTDNYIGGLTFNVAFSSGLRIVIAGGTAAEVSVIYE